MIKKNSKKKKRGKIYKPEVHRKGNIHDPEIYEKKFSFTPNKRNVGNTLRYCISRVTWPRLEHLITQCWQEC